MLHDDRDEEDRGAAVFLLAHLHDGDKLVALMLAALDDPSSLVRNNAACVLWDVATWHPDIAIPLEPVRRRVDDPNPEQDRDADRRPVPAHDSTVSLRLLLVERTREVEPD